MTVSSGAGAPGSRPPRWTASPGAGWPGWRRASSPQSSPSRPAASLRVPRRPQTAAVLLPLFRKRHSRECAKQSSGHLLEAQVLVCGGGSQRLALRPLTTAMTQPCPARAAQTTLHTQSRARGLDTIGVQSAFGEGMNEQKNSQRQAQHCRKYSTNTFKFFTLSPCKHPTKWV